uniref:Uncharacterized protein n=1 Tax=Mandrillus leucophaeus TaxID=9568 RepID=A0A2K5Z1X8_MANLE
MLKEKYFQMHYVNGQKKHSICRDTGISHNVFWSVFRFTVYIPALKTQGQALTKERYKYIEILASDVTKMVE